MKRLAVLLLLILFLPAVSAQDAFEIREDSCESFEENLFSLNDKEGGNIGDPGYFRWQVCTGVVDNSEIREGCDPGEDSLISMENRNDTHASIYEEFRWDVCIPNSVITFNDTCVNSNPVVSMYSETDSHVAEPGYFENQICHSFADVNSITLDMSIDSTDIYVDGESADERTYNPVELEYPYITSDRPAGIVSYGELESIEYSEDTGGNLRVTQNGGSFLLPFTEGGTDSIEAREGMVNDRTFLDQLNPSFAFFIPETPNAGVIYDFNYTAEGFNNPQTGRVELAVRNKFTDSDEAELLITDK